MNEKPHSLELVETLGSKKVRRRNTTKRKTAAELTRVEQRAICEEFRFRGAGSDVKLAEECQAQRSEVQSVLIDGHERRLEKLERGLDILLAKFFMRGAASPDRKQPHRETRIRMVSEGVA